MKDDTTDINLTLELSEVITCVIAVSKVKQFSSFPANLHLDIGLLNLTALGVNR